MTSPGDSWADCQIQPVGGCEPNVTNQMAVKLRRHAERAPALEKELAQLAAEQQRCRQEGTRVLPAIGGDEAGRSDMTTKHLAELDERASQLEQRMAELRDELAAVQREAVSAAESQRAGRRPWPLLAGVARPPLMATLGVYCTSPSWGAVVPSKTALAYENSWAS
jgi:hypothetical protein